LRPGNASSIQPTDGLTGPLLMWLNSLRDIVHYLSSRAFFRAHKDRTLDLLRPAHGTSARFSKLVPLFENEPALQAFRRTNLEAEIISRCGFQDMCEMIVYIFFPNAHICGDFRRRKGPGFEKRPDLLSYCLSPLFRNGRSFRFISQYASIDRGCCTA
jgi:hypothetical protein